MPPEDFSDHLYTYHDDAAVRHLFRVAAGVDSMVLGESEILGQVRRAFQVAAEVGSARRLLGAAFRRALHVGKRARSETAISRNPASISSAAVDLAKRAFGDDSLVGKRVVVVGAGEMGNLAARALARAGARDLTIVNRSEERARDMASRFAATPQPLAELQASIARADIVICCTTAPQTIMDRVLLEEAMAGRRDAPLFVVDIAVPRDVDPDAAEVPGVVLRDIDDLRGVVDASLGSRLGEVSRVEEIIGAELESFTRWERSTEVGPTVAALIERAEAIRRDEVDRLMARRGGGSEAEREAIDRATKRIVAKLLHEPLKKARELGGSKQGYTYLSALRELFELDDEPHP